MNKYNVKIMGMHCSDCEERVKRALENSGAFDISVSYKSGEVTFSYDQKIDLALKAIDNSGHKVISHKEDSNAVSGTKDAFYVSSSKSDYDLVVIGSGAAAFSCAIEASERGAKVAMVEKGQVGGTCVNVGCIPSKTLIGASHAFYMANNPTFRSIKTKGESVNFLKLVKEKNKIVAKLCKEKYLNLIDEYNFHLIRGSARFQTPDSLEVRGKEIFAGAFVIATGASPFIPPIKGINGVNYLTSTTAMELTQLPKSLIVVGGNYIGLELGQFFSNLGSSVSIVEALDRLVPFEEPEISKTITDIFKSQGIKVFTSSQAKEAFSEKNLVGLRVIRGAKSKELFAEQLLIATGRKPNLESLNLQKANIRLDSPSRLILNDYLQTTNNKVFGAGDVTGFKQFVYVAAYQGAIAANNALGGAPQVPDYKGLPQVTFTSPAIASVGLTEEQASEEGIETTSKFLELKNVPRAIVSMQTKGGIKMVIDKKDKTLLGIHMIAEGAPDSILAGVYAVKEGFGIDKITSTFAPYLTMSEAIKLVAQSFTKDVSRLSCCAG